MGAGFPVKPLQKLWPWWVTGKAITLRGIPTCKRNHNEYLLLAPVSSNFWDSWNVFPKDNEYLLTKGLRTYSQNRVKDYLNQ